MDKKDKVFIIITCILFFTLLCTGGTAVHYKNKYGRLVEQNRMELTIARNTAAVLSDTITRAREEVGAIGESLGKQRTSVAELREIFTEIRARYEKMEDLLNSVGVNNFDIRTDYSSTAITNEEQVGEEYKCLP